jgi:hypothetical protein
MNSVMFGLKTSQFGVKTIVHGKGNLVDFERVGGNVVKGGFVLVLDSVLEGADIVVTVYFGREDVTWIVAKHDTVDAKIMMHEARRG